MTKLRTLRLASRKQLGTDLDRNVPYSVAGRLSHRAGYQLCGEALFVIPAIDSDHMTFLCSSPRGSAATSLATRFS